MKTPIKPKTAAPTGAGKQNEKLAKAWLAWIRGGSARGGGAARAADVLGEVADQALRKLIREGTLRDALRGREEELRQDAAELLFGTFLHGNTRLIRASAAGSVDEIARQIGRSIAAAAKFGRKRYIKKAQQEIQRRALLAQAVEDGVLIQAAQDGFELNREARMKLAMMALAHAVRSGRIDKKSAEMARVILKGDKCQKEIAAEQGISAAAVSQRIKRTAEEVRVIIERGEVEL